MNNDWLTSYDEYLDVIATGNVVILFTAPAWCAPCQKFEPHWDRAKTSPHVEDVKFYRVDLDDNEWVMLELGIRSVPTIYIHQDGAVVKTPQASSALNLVSDILSIKE